MDKEYEKHMYETYGPNGSKSIDIMDFIKWVKGLVEKKKAKEQIRIKYK